MMIEKLNNKVIISFFDFTVPVVVIYTFSPIIALTLAAISLLFIPISYICLKINVIRREATYEPIDNLTGVIVDNLANFETVKSFAKEENEQKRISAHFNILNPVFVHYLDSFRILDTALLFFNIALIATGIHLGIQQYQAGAITIASLVAILGYLFAYPGKVHSLFYDLPGYLQSSGLVLLYS